MLLRFLLGAVFEHVPPEDRLKRRFATALIPRLFGNSIPSHTTREPPIRFEWATEGIQFYVIANSGLDKDIPGIHYTTQTFRKL